MCTAFSMLLTALTANGVETSRSVYNVYAIWRQNIRSG